MFIFKKYKILVFLLISNTVLSQQIDFKDLVRSDTTVINKNTVFNFYWSSIINKKIKFKRITEFAINSKDTIKLNSLDFDKEGRLKFWNSVAFRYTALGEFIGYVDTLKSEIILPSSINKNAFTDFNFYSESRDVDNNLLMTIYVKEKNNSDSLLIKYLYSPHYYIKAEKKEINGVLYSLPDGPKLYLNKILIFKNRKLFCQRFIKYEVYEE
jgi:hypothetical protein